ncbi:hypothetical protein [Chelativorans salis]|uniref:Uncharacterized protein n=1 Tax=Chelativorans salis TaxID=2978478 RepID=A0ABT2LNC8_9HYPH|nr:hypothetical protein [Chelativorans sp. EGI FJ00035]MCT7376028.1 hypothetical protein [Chelativorans sp. EGI FJ00035]
MPNMKTMITHLRRAAPRALILLCLLALPIAAVGIVHNGNDGKAMESAYRMPGGIGPAGGMSPQRMR